MKLNQGGQQMNTEIHGFETLVLILDSDAVSV